MRSRAGSAAQRRTAADETQLACLGGVPLHGLWPPEVVALAVTLKPKQWKPLLRWWGRWRRIQAPQTARDLIAAGWQPGPAIGEELRRQRSAAQDRSR